jgi:LAO/AO transport system kinase
VTINAAQIKALAAQIKKGSRLALSRAITLIESTTAADRTAAGQLLQSLLPHTGGSIRLGLTGAPGCGKSTLIDQLGLNLITLGKRVAVLAIDPSSTKSGGSILADKTRMGRLSALESAFIRPSPSSGKLGGDARNTHETLLLCEAAGFDVVIVETVGIGQSEAVIADIVDFVAILIQPGTGDELQGLKRGVLEVANMIVVTKSDGEGLIAAARTAGDYAGTLHIMTAPGSPWDPPVQQVSAIENQGLDEMWVQIERHQNLLNEKGILEEIRRDQAARRLRVLVEEEVLARFHRDEKNSAKLQKLERMVRSGELTPGVAADDALK